jgi:predicted Zn-dependent protease
MDWARTEREIERALRLDPQSVEARAAKVSFLYFVGRFDDAIREAYEEAWLQARTEQPKIELARALFLGRRYDDAISQLTSVLERDPSRFRPHLLLGEVLAGQGKFDSAIPEMQAAVQSSPSSTRSQAYLAHVYARAGRVADAQTELSAIREKARHMYVPALNFAIAHVALGNMDSTFAWLNRAIDDHSMRPYVFDPTFDTIRSDTRYQQLLRRMHLPYRSVAR